MPSARTVAAYVPRHLQVVVAGIGKTAAAVATTRALVGMDPARTLVVNVGTWSGTSPTTPHPWARANASVAGCRIGAMPFVERVEGGHRDRWKDRSLQ